MPAECMIFFELRKRYLASMRQFIDKTDGLLRRSASGRNVRQSEADRLIREFFQIQEELASHAREHPVHGKMSEDLVFVLADVVVIFCRDGAMIQTREATVAKLADTDLARGLLFSSEQWLDSVDRLAKLIDCVEGQTSERTVAN